jgi:bifunctional UDP-N-acetylglucosamine pyrophosphorylase/glucosamine-1-phosphate N-acetyltransferase
MNKQDFCNDFSTVAAIVPAGGAGSLSNGKPKVLEEIAPGRSILGHILQVLLTLGLGQIVVVVNSFLFREMIQDHLRTEGFDNHVTWALQHWRLGAAEAVAVGLEKLREEINTVLVTYGDMPLWRAQTFRELLTMQRYALADVAMMYVPLSHKVPETIKQYGRIVADEEGGIMQIFELGDEINVDPKRVYATNPSLYAFSKGFVTRNLRLIPMRSKGDGHEPEFHLPYLIGIARSEGVPITAVEVTDPEEALGVNTQEDLEEVRQVLARRKV